MMNLYSFTKALLVIATLFVPQMSSFAWASNTNYYISSSQGNDSYHGTSTLKPWKNLDKIWLKGVLQPGDRVHLKRGDSWHANILIRGAGTPGNPVLLSSYGDGADPIIYGDRYALRWTAIEGHTGVFRAEVGRRANIILELNGAKVIRYKKGSKTWIDEATLNDLPVGQYWTSYNEPDVYFRSNNDKPPSSDILRVVRQQVIAAEGKNIIIENLHIVGGHVAVDAEKTTGFVARGLTIEDVQGIGIYFRNQNEDGLAENNLILRSGNTALYARMSTRITFRGNRVYDVAGIVGDRCLVGLEKSVSTVVEDNLLVNARCGIDYHFDRGSIVRNNVVAKSGNCIVPHGTDMQVYGNTCWLEGKPKGRWHSGTNIQNVEVDGYIGTAEFHDNTIYNCTPYCLRAIRPGVVLRNNVVFGSSGIFPYAAAHLDIGADSDLNTFVVDKSETEWRWGGDGAEGTAYSDFAKFQTVTGQELNSTVEPYRDACWRMPFEEFLASYTTDTNENGIADFCDSPHAANRSPFKSADGVH
ncbi:MAG: right-handed parallel beta-helix repeat-containing protein [Gammaproteobacteria bacterium]|nr:right-handed parallel beta-helix repeat-containing protein [Gammaproteobacteria bacterium]